MQPRTSFASFCLFLLAAAGCSVKKLAINSLGDALAESVLVYASDNDLELVREAMPFGLKTVESLIVQSPRHRGLLVAAASGFTQYAYAFVEMDAYEAEPSDPSRARELRRRAKKLYLRARDYGLQALNLRQPGFREKLAQDAAALLAPFRREHVLELYWTAAAWALAISVDKEDLDLVADLHLVDAMIKRALELDETFDRGTIHDFLIVFEGSRAGAMGGSIERARKHFQRATELSGGRRISPLVSLAENVSVGSQNRQEFEQLLQRALAFDVNQAPEFRLANLLAQKRAKILLSRTSELFIED